MDSNVSFDGNGVAKQRPCRVPMRSQVVAAAGPRPCRMPVRSQPVEKFLYDRKSAAAALSISVRSLDYLLANKALRTRRIGRKVLIPAGELRRFAQADHFSPVATATSDAA